jgi:hypothetical protein
MRLYLFFTMIILKTAIKRSPKPVSEGPGRAEL